MFLRTDRGLTDEPLKWKVKTNTLMTGARGRVGNEWMGRLMGVGWGLTQEFQPLLFDFYVIALI